MASLKQNCNVTIPPFFFCSLTNTRFLHTCPQQYFVRDLMTVISPLLSWSTPSWNNEPITQRAGLGHVRLYMNSFIHSREDRPVLVLGGIFSKNVTLINQEIGCKLMSLSMVHHYQWICYSINLLIPLLCQWFFTVNRKSTNYHVVRFKKKIVN